MVYPIIYRISNIHNNYLRWCRISSIHSRVLCVFNSQGSLLMRACDFFEAGSMHRPELQGNQLWRTLAVVLCPLCLFLQFQCLFKSLVTLKWGIINVSSKFTTQNPLLRSSLFHVSDVSDASSLFVPFCSQVSAVVFTICTAMRRASRSGFRDPTVGR